MVKASARGQMRELMVGPPPRQIRASVPVREPARRLTSNLYAAVLIASTGCASGKRQLPFRISRRGRYNRTM